MTKPFHGIRKTYAQEQADRIERKAEHERTHLSLRDTNYRFANVLKETVFHVVDKDDVMRVKTVLAPITTLCARDVKAWQFPVEIRRSKVCQECWKRYKEQ